MRVEKKTGTGKQYFKHLQQILEGT